MSKGRWKNFSIKSNEPRLYAIIRNPDGTLTKKPVKKEAQTMKKYEGYVRGLQGLYIPRSILPFLRQPKGEVKE